MELIPKDVCMLCEQSTALLTSRCVTPFIKYLSNTFFDKNENGLKQFQGAVTDRSLCVLCTHKIVISHKFKNIYEEICNKRTSFKKTRSACFLCESKTADLIKTDDNPNDFHKNIKSFMDSSLNPRPYMQCVICFDCIFYLNIWCEVNSNVINKINNDDEVRKSSKRQTETHNKILKKIQSLDLKDKHNTKSDNVLPKKEKENITPSGNTIHVSRKRSRPESESSVAATPQKRTRSSATTISESDHEVSMDESVHNITANKNKKSWSKQTKNDEENVQTKKEFLKVALMHLKSVREISDGNEWPESISKDRKMFTDIPYVIMFKDDRQITSEKALNYVDEPVSRKRAKLRLKSVTNRKIGENNTRRSDRLNKPIELIELSETESETNTQSELTQKGVTKDIQLYSSVKQKDKIFNEKEIRNDSNKKFRRKIGIKIKMSSSFSVESNSVSGYTCNICDKVLSTNCDYKAHDLWHEKPENIVISVTRSNLPAQIKASQFDAGQSLQNDKKQKSISATNIDKIVQKYVSFPVSDTCEDADLNNSNEMEGIIENLNSPENEEGPKDSNEPEKNKELLGKGQNECDSKESEKDDEIELKGRDEQEESENEEYQGKRDSENGSVFYKSDDSATDRVGEEKSVDKKKNLEGKSKRMEELENENEESENLEKIFASNEDSEKISASIEDSEKISASNDDSEEISACNEDLEKISVSSEDSEKISAPNDDSEKISACNEDLEKISVSSENSEKISASNDDSEKISACNEDLEKISASKGDSEKDYISGEDYMSGEDYVSGEDIENFEHVNTIEKEDEELKQKNQKDNVQTEQEEFDSEDNCISGQSEDDEKQEMEGTDKIFVKAISETYDHEKSDSEDDAPSIEKQLAEIHGDLVGDENEEHSDDNSYMTKTHVEEKKQNSDEEIIENGKNVNNGNSKDSDSNEIVNDMTTNGYEIEESRNSLNEMEQNENEKEVSKTDSLEEVEVSNKGIGKKRKRVGNLVIVDNKPEENCSDVEIVTPKPKRVRFAMDYSTPISIEDDSNQEIMFEKIEKEDSDLNSCNDLLEEIKDDNMNE